MVGRYLRELREQAGMTQEQLANKAKLHRTYVSMLERDLRSPTIGVFMRLCKVLGIRGSELLARIEAGRG